MSNITVSIQDRDDETVIAEYYQMEDGWVTFKTVDGKAVASYPERLVTRILSNTPQPPEAATEHSECPTECIRSPRNFEARAK
jgi:hypothetical protein